MVGGVEGPWGGAESTLDDSGALSKKRTGRVLALGELREAGCGPVREHPERARIQIDAPTGGRRFGSESLLVSHVPSRRCQVEPQDARTNASLPPLP